MPCVVKERDRTPRPGVVWHGDCLSSPAGVELLMLRSNSVGFIGPGCGWLKEACELIHRVLGLGQVRQESVLSTLENSSPVHFQQ
jgi:hypothetical protein